MTLFTSYPFKTIVLVGGKGTRLSSVTGNRIPKGFVEINSDKTIRGIDHIISELYRAGITDIVLSLGYYSEFYEEYAKGKPFTLFYQHPTSGTSGAVEDVIKHYGNSYQYIVLSGDIFFDHRDLLKIIHTHKENTITWGVTPLTYSIMKPYYGLVVDTITHAVTGDINLSWQEGDTLDGKQLYVKGAINIIDPQLYINTLNNFRALSDKVDSIDLYWDILPLLEALNRRQVSSQRSSLLQASILDFPLIDYGTPERLEFTRTIYRDQVFPVFDPIREDFLTYKYRSDVHTNGDWHRGIQAHIVRPNSQGSFDMLVQVRSQIVDIGKGKYDQSLATQMVKQDGFSELTTLHRGLFFELGIKHFLYEKLDAQLRIIKTYEDDPGIFNRELISLFFVYVEDESQISAVSPKLKELVWMSWDSLLKFFDTNRLQFTKTAQFYLGNSLLRRAIESTTLIFLGLPTRDLPSSELANTLLLHVDIIGQNPKTFSGDDAVKQSYLFQ